MKRSRRRRIADPIAELVSLVDRVVTQIGLLQFQINLVNRRLDVVGVEKPERVSKRKASSRPK